MNIYGAPEEIHKPDFMDFFGPGKGSDVNGYMRADEQYIADVAQYVVDNGEAHKLAGKVVRKPYADGYAVYVVGKFNGRVGLVHIDTGDGWRDGSFERTATVAELTRMVAAQDARNRMFA